MSKFKYFSSVVSADDIDKEINEWIKSQPYTINIIRWKMEASDHGRFFVLIEYD